MVKRKKLEGIKHVVHISTINEPYCRICGDGWDRRLHDFEYATNHYLEKHGYTLLYVGNETHRNKDTGEVSSCTVAVLGSDLRRSAEKRVV